MPDTLYEKFETENSTQQTELHSVYRGVNTFTPSISHTVTSVAFMVYIEGTPGNATAEIRATTGSIPSGAVMVAKVQSANSWGVGYANRQWSEFVFATGVDLNASTEYSAIIYGGTDESNAIHWMINNDGGYSGGQRCNSSDSGANWAANAGTDGLFREYGIPIITTNPKFFLLF